LMHAWSLLRHKPAWTHELVLWRCHVSGKRGAPTHRVITQDQAYLVRISQRWLHRFPSPWACSTASSPGNLDSCECMCVQAFWLCDDGVRVRRACLCTQARDDVGRCAGGQGCYERDCEGEVLQMKAKSSKIKVQPSRWRTCLLAGQLGCSTGSACKRAR
jgi:hypothetical protein